MTTETPVPLSTLGKATSVSACEQDGFYLCPSTAIFFGLIILCLGCCAALLINDVAWTSTQLKYKGTFQNGDLDPSFNMISFGILLCYILIHVFGYRCGLISTSLSQCQKGFIACAGIVVFCSFLNVFVVGWTEGVTIPFKGHAVLCFTSIQALAMIGFIIASYKLHCFGGCYTRSKVVFYVVGILNILYGALFILECLVFYDSDKKMLSIPHNHEILGWTPYKTVAPVAYVLQVALCLCAYQVSLCHIRFTPIDVAFLCIGGLMVGTLVAVTFSAYGKDVHQYVVYPLMALHVIISVGLLMLTHQNRPLAQFEGGDLLGGSSWDVLYVVIAVDSLVCIAGGVSTIFAKYENRPQQPPPPQQQSIERVEISKQLLGLHIYVTIQLLVLTKLKKPFNKYYTADYLSAIILAMILAILLVGTAVGYGWAKLGSHIHEQQGSSRGSYLTYKDPDPKDYVPFAVYLLVVIAAFLTFGYKCNILEVWGDWISDKAGTYYKENPNLKSTADKP